MFCPFCGTNVANDQRFCPNCGADVQAEMNGATQGAQEQSVPLATPTQLVEPVAEPAPLAPPESNATNDLATTQEEMPSTGSSMAFVIVGFLCGVIWGAIGLTQYNGMKRAIEAGDVQTAKSKAGAIKIITIIGLVFNGLLLMTAMS